MEWQELAGFIGPLVGAVAVIVGAWLGFRGKKVETHVAAAGVQQNAVSERWDDASELATRMREYIAQEVERQVKPIREELERVKAESHEMNDAVRARETQLWLWDQRGRVGVMPMLPAPLLQKLGLALMMQAHADHNTHTQEEP